jgi:hypothetical protein
VLKLTKADGIFSGLSGVYLQFKNLSCFGFRWHFSKGIDMVIKAS